MKVFMFAALAIVAMVAVSCSDESVEPEAQEQQVEQKVSIKRKDNSDYLGKVAVYFYDPIIEGVDGENYLIHEYSTGTISFCVVAY